MFKPEARIGTVVRRYRLDQVLSSGGMGSLYRATHERTGREVAVKFLLDLDDAARFAIEARATVELKHPNVVDVLDMDETDDGVPFLVMELLLGRTLSAELEERGRLSPEEVHAHLLPVMGAVAHAHARGILHRDLKPDNIFLARAPDGRIVPKLLDFGIAKTRAHPTITRSGAIVGTPAYMSPEQALAEQELTAASDVWSMGIVLFECLAGKRPFEGDSATSVLLKVVRDPPPRLELSRPDLPLPWLRAIDRALQRQAALRPQNMGEYARRLLVGALEAGMAVPDDPDPVGLPAWRAWREQRSAGTLSLDSLPSELPGSTAHTGALAMAPTLSAAPARRLPWRKLAVLLLVLGGALFLFTRTQRAEVPEVSVEPKPVAPEVVVEPTPASEARPKPVPEEPAPSEPALGPMPTSPPTAVEPTTRVRTRPKPARPPVEAPAPKSADRPARDLPTIESDWR